MKHYKQWMWVIVRNTDGLWATKGRLYATRASAREYLDWFNDHAPPGVRWRVRKVVLA